MALPSPTLREVADRTEADVTSRLEGADAGIVRTPEHVLARVIAGVSYGIHGMADQVVRNAVPNPDADADVLERWADLYGVPRLQPTPASGTLLVTGDDTTVIPEGTQWQSASGVIYESEAEVTIDNGAPIPGAFPVVTALTPGADGNLGAGSIVSLVSPIGGVDTDATVIAGGELDGGADLESLSALWVRLQERVQDPPGAGTEADYVRWAKGVAGVTRAWAEGNALGAGSVRILFVRDAESPITPSAGEIADVQAAIDLVRPVTANAVVAAPTAVTLDVTATVGLDASSGLSQSEVEANITDQLEAMLLREAEPGGTIRISHVREAISLAHGEAYHSLTVPAADVTHTALQLPILGTLTINWA